MQDVDKLRQRLIDRQTIIDQAINRWWFRLRAWVTARGGHFEHLISSNVLLLHYIVSPNIFILYVMFHLNVRYGNGDVQACDATDIGYDTCTHAAFWNCIIKILFKRDRQFQYHSVPNLMEYICAKNCQKRALFDKVIATIKWCSFFDSQCTILLQGVVLEESGETPKTETHQKNSNIIYTHPKSKYWNIQKKLCHLFKQTTTGVHDAFLPWKCE